MKFTPTLSRNLILVLLLLTFGLSEAQINTPSGAVVPFGANKTYAYGILPTNLPSGGTYGQAQDAANAYNTWRSFYVEDCGGSPKKYRVKFDDPNKTVSEGIAYGMLLAAYAADKPLFDGLWAYFNQFTTNGLMSWRVDGCNGANQQSGSASDSDFDAAFALLVAKNQWPTGTTYNGNTYNTEANAIIAKIRKTDGTGDMASDGQAINGNTWGSSDSRRNPSYQSPAYYREYATQVSDNFWSTTAVNGAYTLLNNNISQGGGGKGLVSDWSYNTGALTTFNGGTGYTPTLGYGYDACRNPMRMAQDVIWNNNSNATAILASMAAYLNSRGVNNVGGPLNPNGTNYAGYSQNATFYSTFAMGLVGSNSTYQSLLNQFYSKVVSTTDVMQNQSLSGYFGNTLRVLSLFMMTGNMWKIGTTSLQDINVKVNGVDVPSNTVYDFQNVQTGTGKSITFVIENKGFASLALTATPKVAISGSTNYVVNQSSVSSPLALGGTTNFSVTLTPNTAGTRTAVITIANNDPDASESTYTITLTGIGTQFATSPNILVKQGSTTFSNGSSYSMGNATQAATSTQTFQVINTGDAPLNISSISVTGATFALSGTAPTVVAVGGTANFNVSFTPAAATTYNGTVRISSNDASDPLFIINVSGVGVACPSSSVTNVIQDWDANSNLVATWTSSVGYAITATTNPAIGVLNTSPTVLLKRRNPTVAANSYSDGFRFNLCGSTVNALNMTGKGTISMLVYSSAANIPITMALDNNASLSPPYANVASNIQYTTKVNQWERLYFDLSGATGNTNVRYITFQINPTAVDAGTYYFDDIRYDVPLCPSLTSSITSTGVFHDFDNLKNISLQYVYGAQVSTSGVSLNQFATNPSVGSTNTSSGVAQYIRGVDGQYSTSGFNFLLCTGVPFPNSASKVISMLVYSPKVGAKVQINAYNGATSYSSVAQTTLANQWEKLYFNFTNYTALTSVTQLEFFFDASAVSVPSAANRTYYFDQVQFDSNPCVTGIPTTGIFNDYDFNRYVNLAFQPIGTINEAAANPSAIGINTSSGVAQYTRPSAATQYDIIRYSACQGAFDLSAGKTTINLMVYSSLPSVEVTMSLKLADGTTSGSNVTVTATGAGAWKQLSFDNIAAQGRTDIAFIDIMVDPLGKNGSSVYYIDNLQYAPPAPRITLVQGATNLPTNASFSMGLLTSCGVSSSVDFQVNNQGLADLILTGSPVVSVGGVNASDFTVTYSPQFANPVSALSGTQFTLNFAPNVLGPRSAVVRINSNDATRNPYILYVNGTTNVAIGNTGNIFGLSTVCSGYIGQYYTPSVSGASAYNWTVPSGATITAGQGTSVVTVNWGLSSGGTLSVSPYSSCITGTSANLTVAVGGAPTASGGVVGLSSPCAGTTGTYSIPGVANASGYIWTVPAGSTISSGTNTNSISVLFGSTNGNISVLPFSACGTATGITPKAVTISPSPAAAGAISGLTTVCGGTSSTFNIASVTGATSYIWSFGNASGSSTSNTISVTFPSGAGISTLTVSPVFACGNGAPSTKSVTINTAPVAPSSIVGNASSCANSVGVGYSITPINGASSYSWSVPSGSSVASGQGTSSVTVNFGSTPGNINVSAINSCGTTLGTAKTISINAAPSGSGTIAGNSSPCVNTSATYTVSGISGATSYIWTLPSGSTGTNSTNSIAVTFGTNNGNITARGINACGTVTSSAFAITLSPAPAAAGAIIGVTSACSGITRTYSISPVANATGYVWSVSGGSSSISSGQGTTSINALLSGSGSSTIQVVPQFSCGAGTASSVSVNVVPNVTPSISISAGNLQLCSGQSSTITVSGSNLGSVTTGQYVTNNVPGAVTSINTYTFTPVNNNTVYVIATTSGGCFTNPVMSSNTITYSVSSAQTPAVLIGITAGSANSCAADFVKFTAITSAAGTSPTFQWKNGSNDVGTGGNTFGGTNFANGSAISVVLTSSLSCATQSTANSNVVILNTTATGIAPCVSPAITTILGLTTVNQNDANVVYSVPSIAGAIYNWTVPGGAVIVSGQGTNSIIVNFGVNGGDIVVAVTNNYGTTTYNQTINVLPTDYNSDITSTEIRLYPNPSNETFNIGFGQSIANQISVEITDNKGVVVYRGENISGANLGSNLTAGHYVVSVITSNRVKRLQFLKMD